MYSHLSGMECRRADVMILLKRFFFSLGERGQDSGKGCGAVLKCVVGRSAGDEAPFSTALPYVGTKHSNYE